MDLSDLFAVNKRIIGTKIMSKQVNGRTIEKTVVGGFCWWAFFFTAFYAMFSKKYKTKGFITKMMVNLLILVLINCGLSYLFDDSDWLWNFAEAIYFGLMFNTWYYNQLIRNGYHENHQHESLEFE
ncbi:hypothetical protein [Lactiplantibacillus plantarum]|uniref:hypothetical protein n=1 Tax=Lactiplantibacillus plantarum TaxID=1590 RepID=UPI0012D3C5BD|nr:hypothetical protein [Lactiplantibacillus plantarum]QGQ38611.1 hypothetical protein GMA16_13340 [Lactiplantibacillus plantarum]WNC18971.1 hypothetical protein RIF09_13100 [Lactiplantibacillus plantarum]